MSAEVDILTENRFAPLSEQACARPIEPIEVPHPDQPIATGSPPESPSRKRASNDELDTTPPTGLDLEENWTNVNDSKQSLWRLLYLHIFAS